jgi:large subunit ribosomal protein L23
MKTAHDIIVRPIVTERSMAGASARKYTFEVDSAANKIEIARAVEEVFGVKVQKVNTVTVHAKKARQSMGSPEGTKKAWKKAIVQLTPDSKSITFFDSLM